MLTEELFSIDRSVPAGSAKTGCSIESVVTELLKLIERDLLIVHNRIQEIWRHLAWTSIQVLVDPKQPGNRVRALGPAQLKRLPYDDYDSAGSVTVNIVPGLELVTSIEPR
jgi:hypothetical protein